MLINAVCAQKKRFNFLLATMLIVVFASGCAGGGPPSQSTRPLPHGTPLSINVPVCQLSACVNFSPVPGAHVLNDTWQNIHPFLTFDDKVASPYAAAKNYEFVWGAGPDHVYSYRLGNPKILLSYYIPINVDDGTFTNTNLGHERGIDQWRVWHPDWVLYKCDRTTPAYEFANSNVPFDLTNPDVFAWQMQSYVQPAENYGYDAIALDNVNMENQFGACGHFDKNGNWVQLFSGQNVDPQWEQAMVNWVTKMQAALHALPHPMLLIANISAGHVSYDDPMVKAVVSHVDGVLDESSFTHYGEYHLSDDQWVQMVHYVENVQQQDKPFFLVNEFNNTRPITNDDVEWVIGSYLMCKQHLAEIYISPIQGYGTDRLFPQYGVQIGSPRGDMYQAQNVYWRDYTNGEVIVNPSNNAVTVNTASITTAKSFTDLYGQHLGQSFTVPALSAKVLLTK